MTADRGRDALAEVRDHRNHGDEAVAALANIDDFVERGKASLTDEDVANLKAMLALDLTLIAPRVILGERGVYLPLDGLAAAVARHEDFIADADGVLYVRRAEVLRLIREAGR